jgi:hypothetical protein
VHARRVKTLGRTSLQRVRERERRGEREREERGGRGKREEGEERERRERSERENKYINIYIMYTKYI